MRTTAAIYAFDVEFRKLNLCKNMARKNAILQKMRFNGCCGPDELIKTCDRRRCLVFSDCEGYEVDLFTTHGIERLREIDYLIGFHETARESLPIPFLRTHSIQIITEQNSL